MPDSVLAETSCVSVVMPIHNEAATVERIIGAVLAQPIVAELIAIDDGSTDRTGELLTALRDAKPSNRRS